MDKLVFTGGSGLLGKEMQKHFPNCLYPTHQELDVTSKRSIAIYFKKNKFDCIIHLAALTSPPRIDADPLLALEANISGTANIVAACMMHKKKIVYISTDYVFKGDRKNYRETDAVSPVNKYAWSKLGGECAVRMHDNHLIIRTSFGPMPFPYKQAFMDQWTSREPVAIVANKIKKLILANAVGIYHVGGVRRTVHEYAVTAGKGKEIVPVSRKKMNFTIPKDTSLNTDKYEKLINKK